MGVETIKRSLSLIIPVQRKQTLRTLSLRGRAPEINCKVGITPVMEAQTMKWLFERATGKWCSLHKHFPTLSQRAAVLPMGNWYVHTNFMMPC